VNSLITDRESILQGLKEALTAIVDKGTLEKEQDALQDECEVMLELLRKMVQENARVTQDQDEYNAKYSNMTKRYDKAGKQLAEVMEEIEARNAKRNELESFLKVLDSRDELLKEFDESLWLGIVHQMKVHSGNEFTFVLKDGTELIWTISKR
jgi:predicted nuclease with TOPRIM domain